MTLVPGYFHFEELEQVRGAKAPHRHLLRPVLQSLLLLGLVHVCIRFSLVASVRIVRVPVFILFINFIQIFIDTREAGITSHVAHLALIALVVIIRIDQEHVKHLRLALDDLPAVQLSLIHI